MYKVFKVMLHEMLKHFTYLLIESYSKIAAWDHSYKLKLKLLQAPLSFLFVPTTIYNYLQ